MGMKAIYGCIMFLLLASAPLLAQEQPPSADQIVSKMQSKLDLTQDQVAAITPIIEKYTSKRQELRQGAEDGTIERGDMRAQMKQLKEDEAQELSQVLSADQMKQWDQMQKQMHQHGGDGDNHHSDGGGDNTHPDGDNPPQN